MAESLRDYISDTGVFLENELKEGRRVLLEAQLGAMRDIDYGIFPYTSSSNTIAAYAPIGAGIPGEIPDHVVGVLKAYSTCVGAGPFVAEKAMDKDWMEELRRKGGEFGAATGRPRRVGPFDAVASRYGLRCQKADRIALTKLDVLSGMEEIPVITGYRLKEKLVEQFDPLSNLNAMEPVVKLLPGWKEKLTDCRRWTDLPWNAQKYVHTLEQLLDQEVPFISVGAGREEYFTKEAWV